MNPNRTNEAAVTQERLKGILSYDPATGVFVWIANVSKSVRRGDEAGHMAASGYRLIRINGIRYRAHRLAWLYVHGKWPAAFLDHRNNIFFDNRIENLREATKQQNAQNQGVSSNNKSGFKGVSFNKRTRRWLSQIRYGGRSNFLGYFLTPEAAHAAYAAAAQKHHQEFTRLA